MGGGGGETRVCLQLDAFSFAVSARVKSNKKRMVIHSLFHNVMIHHRLDLVNYNLYENQRLLKELIMSSAIITMPGSQWYAVLKTVIDF